MAASSWLRSIVQNDCMRNGPAHEDCLLILLASQCMLNDLPVGSHSIHIQLFAIISLTAWRFQSVDPLPMQVDCSVEK